MESGTPRSKCHFVQNGVGIDFFSVEVKDISLTDYIQVRHAVYVPHTAGRYAKKQFKKAQMPIVERLVDSLMMKGRNNGKKLLTVRIVAHAFEIIHLLTDQNPIQVRCRNARKKGDSNSAILGFG